MKESCINHKPTDANVTITETGRGKLLFVCCNDCNREKLDHYVKFQQRKGERLWYQQTMGTPKCEMDGCDNHTAKLPYYDRQGDEWRVCDTCADNYTLFEINPMESK